MFPFLLRKLSRNTFSSQFIKEIDGLRFIAIMSVILVHLQGFVRNKSPLNFYDQTWPINFFEYLLSLGGYGVQLFFIISAFILSLPFFKNSLNSNRKLMVYSYFSRRFTRIEPPYILNMFLIFFLLVIFKDEGLSLLPHLISSLFYLHGIIFHHTPLVNTVAWSLEIEIQFYILVPLISLIFKIESKWARRLIFGFAFFCLFFIYSFWPELHQKTHFYLVGHLNYFIMGIMLADFYLDEFKRMTSNYLWDLIGVLSVIFITICSKYWEVIFLIELIPILMAFGIIAAFKGKLLNKFFINPWIYTIGGMCYTIYLYHWFIIIAVVPFTLKLTMGNGFTMNFILQMLLTIPIIIVSSSFIYYFTEKPFMSIGRPKDDIQKEV